MSLLGKGRRGEERRGIKGAEKAKITPHHT